MNLLEKFFEAEAVAMLFSNASTHHISRRTNQSPIPWNKQIINHPMACAEIHLKKRWKVYFRLLKFFLWNFALSQSILDLNEITNLLNMHQKPAQMLRAEVECFQMH